MSVLVVAALFGLMLGTDPEIDYRVKILHYSMRAFHSGVTLLGKSPWPLLRALQPSLPAGDYDGVHSEDLEIPPALESVFPGLSPLVPVNVRLYQPQVLEEGKRLPILVYFHGGGFTLGRSSSAGNHKAMDELVGNGHFIGVSVDYRLAPGFVAYLGFTCCSNNDPVPPLNHDRTVKLLLLSFFI